MASAAQSSGMSTRRENRVLCPFVCQMRRSNGMVQPVTIRDMSSGGLQATCFNAPTVGEQVIVRFENGRTVAGMVRWLRKGIFGVEFPAPVNVTMVTEDAKEHPLRRSTDIR